MVGPVTEKRGVRSHTQTSPPACEAIRDSNRSRTGSPSALNIGARPAAWSALSGSRTSGAQHAASTTGTGVGCFVTYLTLQTSNPTVKAGDHDRVRPPLAHGSDEANLTVAETDASLD